MLKKNFLGDVFYKPTKLHWTEDCPPCARLPRAVRKALGKRAAFPAAIVVAALASNSPIAAAAEPFPAEFELSSLLEVNGGDGSAGFVLNGINDYDLSGWSVSAAGDVNGDGIGDVIIGARYGDPGFWSNAGESYVVFGTNEGFPAEIELSSLLAANGGDGSTGFVLNGIDVIGGWSGTSVSAGGDVNGDGIGDLVIGAPRAPENDIGQSYVVFGTDQGFPAEIELSSLLAVNGGDGSAGFVLDNGINFDSLSGWSVSAAGDVNGDGIGDLIVGAYGWGGRTGLSYVVFGTDQGFPAEFELSSLFEVNGGDGSAGFVLKGIDADDFSGTTVSAAGDVNGDGIGDVIVGARYADPGGRNEAGESYVVFGTNEGFSAEFELSSLLAANGGDGSTGFVLNGIDEGVGMPGDRSGFSVSTAGDVNGDGIGDVIVGARYADPGGRNEAGESYVVFGTNEGFPAEFELSSLLAANGGDGSTGFVLNGIDEGVGMPGDRSGSSVSAAGDVNGDGIGDVIIGAPYADPGGLSGAGESYVVFGTNEGFPAEIELSSLLAANGGDGSTGFVLNGIEFGDVSGWAVSAAGDVNGDGIGDVIIGAVSADPGGRPTAGESYVVFGRAQPALGATVFGVNALGAVCQNQTVPQTVFTPLPAPPPVESWDCEALGLNVTSGDSVWLLVRARVPGPSQTFRGMTSRVAPNATVRCVNQTQVAQVTVPFVDGNWSCTGGGLPIAGGDSVSAIITGTAE